MRGMSLNPHIPVIEGQIRNERNNETILQFIIMDATVPLTLSQIFYQKNLIQSLK
jgi:hypothetical protein